MQGDQATAIRGVDVRSLFQQYLTRAKVVVPCGKVQWCGVATLHGGVIRVHILWLVNRLYPQ